jgi:cell division protease FtsH
MNRRTAMELRRFSGVPLLLVAIAVLALLFVLDHANSGSPNRQTGPSEIDSLITQGQAGSAVVSDKNQTIQITTRSGKQLEASWVSGQGVQLRNALQAQLDKGSLPGGYSVIIAGSNALPDVLVPVFIYLVIAVLFLLRIDYPAEIRRWRGATARYRHVLDR